MAKLHVVLDIDDTLLKNLKKPILDMVPKDIQDKLKIVEGRGRYFVLRPGVREFLDFLFANCYVSIWTWSDYDYAMEIANILTDRHPEKFKDILSEEDADTSRGLHNAGGKDLNYLWYDYNEKYATPEILKERNANITETNEDREYRYNPNPKKLFTGYKPCNTILIDDATYNLNSSNRWNLFLIPPWGGHTTKGAPVSVDFNLDDRVFEKMQERLTKIIELTDSWCSTNTEAHILKNPELKDLSLETEGEGGYKTWVKSLRGSYRNRRRNVLSTRRRRRASVRRAQVQIGRGRRYR
jgi:hypothetical protein